MGIEKTLEDLKNALNNLRWEKRHSKTLLGSSLHQEIKQNNRPFSRKVHNMLRQKQQRDLQKKKEVGNWLLCTWDGLKDWKIRKLLSHIGKAGILSFKGGTI